MQRSLSDKVQKQVKIRPSTSATPENKGRRIVRNQNVTKSEVKLEKSQLVESSGQKKQPRYSTPEQKKEVLNPEESNNKRSQSQQKLTNTNFSQNQTKNSQVQELINQFYPYYQHLTGTCVCPSCLCGKCICKVKKPPLLYPNDLKSIYQKDYPWKEGSLERDKNPGYDNYKGDLKSLNQNSQYRSDYLPFKVNQVKGQKPQESQPRNQPFSALSSYTCDYLPFGAIRNVAMRPLDQYTSINRGDLPQLMDTTYRVDYKRPPGEGNDDQWAKDSRYKLHTRSDQPNLYMQTTYQNHYQGKKGERSGCIPVNQSNMPFGQGSAPANYKTLYREHYVPMSLRKCPARVVLEEICDHATDLDPTLPAVSQLYQK